MTRSTLPNSPALNAFLRGEPVRPIGFLPTGRPVYPIAGGAPEDPPNDPPKDPPPSNDPPAFTPPATQAELDQIIGRRLARDRERYADYDALRTKAEAHDKALADAQTEQEKAVEAARAEGRSEVANTANARLVGAEARVLASQAKFRNPSLAVRSIDLTGVTVAEDGTVDTKAIAERLKELSDAEPYLIDAGRPKPDPGQGNPGGKSSSVDAGRDLHAERHKRTTTTS